MPTIQSTFGTFANDASYGTAQWRPGRVGNAQDSDDTDADVNPVPVTAYSTNYLFCSDVTETIPSGTLTEIRVIVEAAANDASQTVSFASVILHNPASETTSDQAAGSLTTDDADYTFTWDAAALATCGIDIAACRLDDFGAKVAFSAPYDLGTSIPDVDQVRIEIDYTATTPTGGGGTIGGSGGTSGGTSAMGSTTQLGEYDEDMVRYEFIKKEALPSCTASTQIFANAPHNTEMVMLTIRDNGLTIQFDGSAPTAGALGHDFAAGERIEWVLNYTSALLIRAIDNGGAATGYITYFTK